MVFNINPVFSFIHGVTMFYAIAGFDNNKFGFIVYEDGSDINDPHTKMVYGPLSEGYKKYNTTMEATHAAEEYLNPKKDVKTKQGVFSVFTPKQFLDYNKACSSILIQEEESEYSNLNDMQALIMKINYLVDFEFSEEELETLKCIFKLANIEVLV